MAARTCFGLFVASLVLAAPAGAQTRSPDLPPELFEPLTPDRATAADSSSGLPIGLAVGLLALVALAGFVAGDRMPRPVRRRSRSDGCWIAVWRSGTSAEFRAVVGDGAGRSVVGRSPVFAAPATGPILDDGPAHAAYDELVAQLQALGWEPAGGESNVWYRSGSSSARP
jgi:hypothetical protein